MQLLKLRFANILIGILNAQSLFVVQNSKSLETQLLDNNIQYGITATCGGFYGPQGRILRLQPKTDF